jgi:hypothetical protein
MGANTDPNAGSSNEDGSPKASDAQQFHMGKGIVNAAGDPFDPPATRLNYLPVVRFIRNEATFDAVKAITYGNTLNKTMWNGLYAKQVWLKPIEATHEVQSADGLDAPEILYWRVRYTFVLKAQGWDLCLLNIGPNYLNQPATSKPTDTNPATGQPYGAYPLKIPFLRDGHPYMDLLKKDGTRYGRTEVKEPTWLHWPIYREVDFTALSIDLGLNLSALRRLRIV